MGRVTRCKVQTLSNTRKKDARHFHMSSSPVSDEPGLRPRLARRAGSTTSLRSPAVSTLRDFYSGRPQRLLPAGRYAQAKMYIDKTFCGTSNQPGERFYVVSR